jgi:hypothetical protein
MKQSYFRVITLGIVLVSISEYVVPWGNMFKGVDAKPPTCNEYTGKHCDGHGNGDPTPKADDVDGGGHHSSDTISTYVSIFPKVFRQYSLPDVFQPSCHALYLIL